MSNDFDDDQVTPPIEMASIEDLQGQLAVTKARAESDARLAAARLQIATDDIVNWTRRYNELLAASKVVGAELERERERDRGPVEFIECEFCAAKPGAPQLCAGCLSNRRVIGALMSANAALKNRLPRQPFDVRCADAMADEVASLIIRKVIDARSPAADALLDYRDPPQTPRAERLAKADAEVEGANANAARWCDIAICRREETAEAIASWIMGYGDEPITAHLAARAIREQKWRR